MAESVLAESNLCGKSLLHLVSSGSAMIAEMLRLSQAVPPVFRDESCFDFAYLKEPEEFESRVNSTEGWLEVDAEFLETHGEFARRAYGLFESVVKYWRDVDNFLERLERGYFIRHTLENVLDDTDGKQLVCEAVFLYGALLTLMEARLPGNVRERLVVAAYREQRARLDLLDEVCKLVRRTDDSKKVKKGASPLEVLLGRFVTERTKRACKACVARLSTDDVYLTRKAFPASRTTRLAAQAGMLFVLLYFDPETLKSDRSAMRQVVDRHFSDTWVVHVYMGHVVDLSKEWADPARPYTAARHAVANALTPSNIRATALDNSRKVEASLLELDTYLTEGQLTEQHLLDHMDDLLDCCRSANAALRWRLLHGGSGDVFLVPPLFFKAASSQQGDSTSSSKNSSRQHAAAAASSADDNTEKGETEKSGLMARGKDCVSLLLKTSQLEYKLKKMLAVLLDTKAEKWQFCKRQVVERMTELSEYFTGDKKLARVRRDDNLTKWFAHLASETEKLDESEGHATMMGRKIQTLVSALEEVEQFEQVDTNVQIKAFLEDTREFLLQMVRITNVQNSVMTILETISDVSYAWLILRDYVGLLHDKIRADPSAAVLLRATFLKLASILDVPLVRISQCDSPDAVSVAEYYSKELVTFVRDVLDVIPISVFRVLDKIVEIQTQKLAPLPVKFESTYLKDYAQLTERYALAKLTHQVGVFTEGVLAMEQTLLGVIKVDPRKILHDGLRKELVRQLARAVHFTLIFPQDDHIKKKPALLKKHVLAVLKTLATKVDGYRRSVEYVQDYIDVAGLKMWQDEMGRLVNYAVEQESNRFLRRKVLDHESKFQSQEVPIPSSVLLAPVVVVAQQHKPGPGQSRKTHALTFIGRTLDALALLTAPEATTYSPEACAWFADRIDDDDDDGSNRHHQKKSRQQQRNPSPPKRRKRVCGVETLDAVERALGVAGLAGLDKLLSFKLAHELTRCVRDYEAHAAPLRPLLEQLEKDSLNPDWLPPQGDPKLFYAAAIKKLDPLATSVFARLKIVGHCQLLRKAVAHALALRSRLDASNLHSAVTALDTALLNDLTAHYRDTSSVPYPLDSGHPDVLHEFSKVLDASGLADPLDQIYVAFHRVLAGLPVVLLVLVLSAASKLRLDPTLGALSKQKLDAPIDGYVLVVGLHTLLKQFHPAFTRQLLAYLGQFVCATLAASGLGSAAPSGGGKNRSKSPSVDDLPPEIFNVAWIVEHLCRIAHINSVSEFIPPEILHLRPSDHQSLHVSS